MLSAPRLRYEPALDGLRGVAVLAVIGYHAQVGFLRGGFLGVDVFFVLSGYLITSLLLVEYAETARVSVRSFYARRSRRLLPALFLLLLGIAAYSAFLAFPGDRGAIRADAFASLLYVQNWHLVWSGTSYFTAFAAPSPLRHLWSLAIEEQFYIVWPLALMLLLRLVKQRTWLLVGALSGVALSSAVLMSSLYHSSADPSRSYYGTDTRAHELLVGALLAVVLTRSPGLAARARAQIRVAGLVATVVVLWFLTHASDTSRSLYRGGFFGFAIATAVVVASVVDAEAGVVRRVLSWAPIRATGRISYGLYLWHWPVLLWLNPDRTGLDGSGLLALRVAVTFASATASYVVIERPVRAGVSPPWRGRRLTLTATFAVVVVVAAVSVSVPATTKSPVAAGLPPGFTLPSHPGPTSPTTTPVQRALLGLAARRNPRLWSPGDLEIQADGRPLADGAMFLPSLDRRDGRAHVVMVGDSVLLSLASYFDPGSASRADYYVYPQIACGFLPGVVRDRGRPIPTASSCSLSRTRWRLLVDRRRPDVSFLMVGATEVLNHSFNGRHYRVGTEAYHEVLREALTRDVDLFASRGGLVVLPTVPCFDPQNFGVAGAAGGRSDRTDPRRVAAVNTVIGEIARDRPDVVRIVDLAGFLCPDGRSRDHIRGVLMRDDGVHFTPDGARIVSRWLAPRLEALIPAGPVFASVPPRASSTNVTP